MATCFAHNVYLCYLPAHCSHGLQPLDNGIFNASKAAYRKVLANLVSLTDSAPVDKINFIRCYAQARKEGMTKKNIQSGWRVTGNWPINRTKALSHPEIQMDRKLTPELDLLSSDPLTPSNSRQLQNLNKSESQSIRQTFRKVTRLFERKEIELALKDQKIQALEAQIERLQPKKRRKVPNPNKRFIQLSEILGGGKELEDIEERVLDEIEVAVEVVDSSEEEEEEEEADPPDLSTVRTRSGRQIRRPQALAN
ncbi:MAG: hypothetical protein ACREBU_23365 [Nitrososphaera sp.]